MANNFLAPGRHVSLKLVIFTPELLISLSAPPTLARGSNTRLGDMTRYGTGPDPSGRTFLLFITFIVIIYYYCVLTREAQRIVVYTTLGCGLVETTPNWAWPIEVRVFPYLLYKEVSTSLLGHEI